jgi:four helix bundle protein
MAATSFTDLDVWQVAHQAALETYSLLRRFPDEERFVLSQQMRRAAISITGNIAEAFGRPTPADRRNFWVVGRGSTEELKSRLLLARDLHLATDVAPLQSKLDRVGAMLFNMIRRHGGVWSRES